MATGVRNTRGHGWLQKYRTNRGGRHLQGRYHYRNVDELAELNRKVFAMNSSGSSTDVTANEVYLDLSIGGDKDSSNSTSSTTAHRIIIELASSILPKTSSNFRSLCQDGAYKQSKIYKIEKTVGICMGDIINNNGTGGKCHESLSSPQNPYTFKDEGYYLSHIGPGIVSMLSSGAHSNDSRFVITTGDAPQLDGRYVAFGRVKEECLEGLLGLVGGVFTKRGRPTVDITVSGCGVVA
jgi:peptidyl-prolyl isomerase H (cyclophilin H)